MVGPLVGWLDVMTSVGQQLTLCVTFVSFVQRFV